MRPLLALPLLLLASCGPKTVYTDADVPKMTDLGDVMWSQAQVMDPQFKKIGRATYNDEDYAAFVAAAGRLKLTTARIKESFSKGPEFNQFADQLSAHASELADAATAKDPARASTALKESKATCKACHAKFK
jgi:cytochrome c556